MSTPPTEGQRLFSRVAFFAQVSLHLPARELKVDLLDIALKGALVRAATEAAGVLNEKCRLVLPLSDGGESITMSGRIVHLEGHNIGIACDDIDLVSLTSLRRLLELNTGDADLMDRELSHLFDKRSA